MTRHDLKRLNPQALARHSALPIGSDGAVDRCDDVARWNVVIESNSLVVDCQRHEQSAGCQRPIYRRLIAIVVEEVDCYAGILSRVFADPVRVERLGRVRPHLFDKAGVWDLAPTRQARLDAVL